MNATPDGETDTAYVHTEEDYDEESSGEVEFDSEDEAIADRIFSRRPGQEPRSAEDVIEFNASGMCTHRVIRNDTRQPFFQRCACAKINYATCALCRVVINLSYTELLWPHVCFECDMTLCVACANRCTRVDYGENIDRFYCDECAVSCKDAADVAAEQWAVVYHASFTDRDRRPVYQLVQLNYQFRTYREACKAAVDGVSLLGVGPLWDAVAKAIESVLSASHFVYDVDTGELLSADDTSARVAVRLTRLHPPGTRILAPPALDDEAAPR